jgi:hypothetical protein
MPIVLKLAGIKIEGFCAEDIYEIIRQKSDGVPITAKLGAGCDSDYFKAILKKMGIDSATIAQASTASAVKPATTASAVKPATTTCSSDIKCVADFGTNIGDPLCCGQEGVLQDTKYVCPNTLQKCTSFKCGSAFGTCTK